jgi:hypothetical protein
MKIFANRNLFVSVLACVVTVGTFLASKTTAAAPPPPNPVLAFVGQESATIAGKKKTRYNFEVTNKDEYPADMFAAAPELPPCGTNTKASRTWIDVYDQSGKRLNGFCALMKPGDLSHIWFALDEDAVPPSWVYIEFTDRKTSTKYKSNLAETTL